MIKGLIRAICTVLVAVFIAVFFAIVAVEWAVGCGETFTDSRGNKHQNECLFVK